MDGLIKEMYLEKGMYKTEKFYYQYEICIKEKKEN